jgi:hypothetical protein
MITKYIMTVMHVKWYGMNYKQTYQILHEILFSHKYKIMVTV